VVTLSFNRKLLPELLVLLVLILATPNVLGTQTDIVSLADSYTSNIYPTANYGGSDFLDSYYYTYEILGQSNTQACVTWLKFDLSGISSEATVNSVILRVHTNVIAPVATNKIGAFLCSDSNWQEMTIIWNNSPQVTGSPISTVFVSAGDKDYDFDVTSTVKGKSIVTLVLKTLESTSLAGFASFYSREKQQTGYRPRLVVDYTSPSQPSSPVDPALWLVLGVIAIVVVLAAYFMMRRRKQQTASKTP
jgi:hypothetical protein